MDMEEEPGDVVGIDAAAALADPARRQVYEFVSQAPAPSGRDDAAQALGIGRSLAAYHLDRLVDQGLLTVTYARRTGRTGPGAGRPAKLYARAPVEVVVQLPPRDDQFVAHLLATAIEHDRSGSARDALRTVTRSTGQALGEQLAGNTVSDVLTGLQSRGYEPYLCDEGIRLRNCPFHHLVGDHLDLVCTLNEDLLGAMVASSGAGLEARLDPGTGHCCVLLEVHSQP
ncbi:MAG: hypothetical protein JWN55_1077 [Frankiales bacterium]|nr:hypothetical protein [Frankiales bacterium]